MFEDFRAPGKSYQSLSQGFGYGMRPWETLVGASDGSGASPRRKGAEPIGRLFRAGLQLLVLAGHPRRPQGQRPLYCRTLSEAPNPYVRRHPDRRRGRRQLSSRLRRLRRDAAMTTASASCWTTAAMTAMSPDSSPREPATITDRRLSNNGEDDEYYREFGQGRGNFEACARPGQFWSPVYTRGGNDVVQAATKTALTIRPSGAYAWIQIDTCISGWRSSTGYCLRLRLHLPNRTDYTPWPNT